LEGALGTHAVDIAIMRGQHISCRTSFLVGGSSFKTLGDPHQASWAVDPLAWALKDSSAAKCYSGQRSALRDHDIAKSSAVLLAIVFAT
jgi:hypothetical protein